ncbi:hypothetical protein SY212_18100 [Ligilactobacillus agilis]|uniref:Uncharacterized protein n=1 Tax=Ligilactobacillus agilis TaxID=1601 RepID=A0A6F9XNP0_9LACO|nr:hypothetical protein [Ligilactobacillus agilis]GET06780.1 hypothetical protein SY212_18100 [Ligilactobacillus agilis]
MKDIWEDIWKELLNTALSSILGFVIGKFTFLNWIILIFIIAGLFSFFKLCQLGVSFIIKYHNLDTNLARAKSDIENLKSRLEDKENRVSDLKKFEELYFKSHFELKVLKNQPISRLATDNDANEANTIKISS